MVVLENDAVGSPANPRSGHGSRRWSTGAWPRVARARDAPGGRCCVDGGRGGLRGAEAFGWDECLPTVAPCPDPADATAPALRDHGEQWGRPADVEATDDRLVATWTRSRWRLRFRRAITLDGAAVDCEYELAAGGDQALPFLWSMPRCSRWSRVRASSSNRVGARVTHHEGFPFAPGLETVAWPGSATALDVVRDVRARQAAKGVPGCAVADQGRGACGRWLGVALRVGSRVRTDARDLARLRWLAARGIAPPGCDRADDVRG